MHGHNPGIPGLLPAMGFNPAMGWKVFTAGFLWFPLRPLGCTYRGQQCPLVVYVQNWNLFLYSLSTLPVIVYSNLLLIKVKEIIGRIHWIKSRPK